MCSFNDSDQTKTMFKKVQASVALMVDMFKRSKFFLCVAQKMNYEDGIVFTENNIVSYLAELEEYISSLITYTAFKRDEPNAAISSIPLDKLEVKEFQKQKTTIDVPTGVSINVQDALNQVEQVIQAKEEDEGVFGIINARDLYQKFQQLHSQGNLTINKASNKNQNAGFNKDDGDQSDN